MGPLEVRIPSARVSSPLVIGGAGGSGTRVVARIARLGGRYMGADRNASEDAMPFARFDWDWGLRYLKSGPSPEMSRRFEETVSEHLAGRDGEGPWGWKHPHSYLLLPFLRDRFPGLCFIHVVRDGRDVAFSENRNQVRRYGGLLRRAREPEAVRSAAWWEWANLHARTDGEAMGDDYLLLRLEDLCSDPVAETRRIVGLSGAGRAESLAAEVRTPGSLGRWRRADATLARDVEGACAEGLHAFGYRLTGSPSSGDG